MSDNVNVSVWSQFDSNSLVQKLALGTLICKLLKDDPDPRAPDAIKRLSEEMVGIKEELEKRGALPDLERLPVAVHVGKPAPAVIGMQTLELRGNLVPAG